MSHRPLTTSNRHPKSFGSNGGVLGGGHNPSSSTAGSTGIHVPAQIRRPRKVLYLIAFFGALYWFSIRHGLGQERQLTHSKDPLELLKEPAPVPGHAGRKPIRFGEGIGKQVGKGGGAGGIWDGVAKGVGLERGAKRKTLDHRLREDGYVEVQATTTAEHPICKSLRAENRPTASPLNPHSPPMTVSC